MPNRDHTYDWIRFIATLMLVMLHSLGQVESIISTGEISLSKIIASAGYALVIPVPLFLMISGRLLLGKEEGIKDFYKKRINRVLIPFLIWSPVIFVLRYIVDGGRSIPGCLTGFIHAFLYTGAHEVYWYIYLILVLYIFTPFIRVIVRNVSLRSLTFLTSMLLLSAIVTQYFDRILISQLFGCKAIIYIFYYFYGYWIVEYLNKHKESAINKSKAFAITIFITCWLLQIMNYTLFESVLPTKTFLACCMFLLFCIYRYKLYHKHNLIIDKVCKYSYGIYLIHTMLIGLLCVFGLEDLFGVFFFLIALIFVIPVSIFSLYILKKILEVFHLHFNVY